MYIQQTAKWNPLLHSKYSKNKPEIKLSIYLDDDKTGEQPSFKAKEAPARGIVVNQTKSIRNRMLNRSRMNWVNRYYACYHSRGMPLN